MGILLSVLRRTSQVDILLTGLRRLFGKPKKLDRSKNQILPIQSPLLQENSETECKSEAQIPIKDVAICIQSSSPRIDSANGSHQDVEEQEKVSFFATLLQGHSETECKVEAQIPIKDAAVCIQRSKRGINSVSGNHQEVEEEEKVSFFDPLLQGHSETECKFEAQIAIKDVAVRNQRSKRGINSVNGSHQDVEEEEKVNFFDPLLQEHSETECKFEAQIPIKDAAVCIQRSKCRIDSVNGNHQDEKEEEELSFFGPLLQGHSETHCEFEAQSPIKHVAICIQSSTPLIKSVNGSHPDVEEEEKDEEMRFLVGFEEISVNHYSNRQRILPVDQRDSLDGSSNPGIDSVNWSYQDDDEQEDEEEEVSFFLGFEERWIKHYSNRQRILLVGEGDFSFSACLAVAFGYASNMVATSLDSLEFLCANYRHALSNLNKLRTRSGFVIHGVDATIMANHAELCGITFDRIIYNFPHAGFFKELSRNSQIRKHQRLVSLFMMNAKKMISENGEIHVSHKTNGFHEEWNLELIASSHGLKLVEAVNFNRYDYSGYHTKYGFGGDNNFNCNPSKTYKFGF